MLTSQLLTQPCGFRLVFVISTNVYIFTTSTIVSTRTVLANRNMLAKFSEQFAAQLKTYLDREIFLLVALSSSSGPSSSTWLSTVDIMSVACKITELITGEVKTHVGHEQQQQ